MWPWMEAHGITPVVWDPVRLLEDAEPHEVREAATLLAQFLTSQSSSHDAGSQGIWATLAQQYLAEVLVVAAELGVQEPPDGPDEEGAQKGVGLSAALNWMMDIKGIGKDPMLTDANLSEEGQRSLHRLEVLANKDDRFQGSVEITIKEVTGALEFTAARGRGGDKEQAPLVPADLTTSGRPDTLYLIADHLSQTTHKPVFAAVSRWLFHVTETHQPDLDERPPRPLFALDELANLARLSDLPSVLSTIRSKAQVICGIQERSQLEAGWGQANAKTLTGNCPVKLQLPGSSDASAMRDWALLAGIDAEDDSDEHKPSSWRTIPRGHARVLADEHPAFTVELADPDLWLADTVPTVEAIAEEPDPPPDPPTGQAEDGRPFGGDGGHAPDERTPPPNMVPPTAADDQVQQTVAAAVTVGNAAAEQDGPHHDMEHHPSEPVAEPPPEPVAEPVEREAPRRPSSPDATVHHVSAGNTDAAIRAASNGAPPAYRPARPPQQTPSGIWLPARVSQGDDDLAIDLVLAAQATQRSGDDELVEYTGDDGLQYGKHPWGFTVCFDTDPAESADTGRSVR